jgi:hypothetical protein
MNEILKPKLVSLYADHPVTQLLRQVHDNAMEGCVRSALIVTVGANGEVQHPCQVHHDHIRHVMRGLESALAALRIQYGQAAKDDLGKFVQGETKPSWVA